MAVFIGSLAAVTLSACRPSPPAPLHSVVASSPQGSRWEASAFRLDELVGAADGEIVFQDDSRTRAARDRLLTDRILGFRLPIPFSTLLAKYGEPDIVTLPTDEELATTPDGQWYEWKLSGRRYVRCLVSEYSRKRDPRAHVELIETGIAPGSTGGQETIAGFVLGATTRRDIELRFGGQLCPAVGRWQQRPALKLVGQQTCTYFVFDTSNRLVGVAQSTSDVDCWG